MIISSQRKARYEVRNEMHELIGTYMNKETAEQVRDELIYENKASKTIFHVWALHES